MVSLFAIAFAILAVAFAISLNIEAGGKSRNALM